MPMQYNLRHTKVVTNITQVFSTIALERTQQEGISTP